MSVATSFFRDRCNYLIYYNLYINNTLGDAIINCKVNVNLFEQKTIFLV